MDELKDIELRPCPFCGGEAAEYSEGRKCTDNPYDDVFYRFGWIECEKCGCRTKDIPVGYAGECDDEYWNQPNFQYLANIWNRRQDPCRTES